MAKRHPANVSGDWYIDDACIDCMAARTVAPGLIVRKGGQSVFARQPRNEHEAMMAWRARLLCPTASVRTERAAKPPADVFPEPMTRHIFRLGYNARSSFGAHSFLIRQDGANVMIDAPRWTGAVVETLETWGGLGYILLSHRDDVGDAARYAAHFGARVVIHDWDKAAAPFATDRIEGRDPAPVADRILAIPVPGHTRGSVVYLAGRALFTGDSLAWSFEENDLMAWRRVCWYSWPEQTRSLERLLDYDFSWVFAGHGGSKHLPVAQMRARLGALVARMKRA